MLVLARKKDEEIVLKVPGHDDIYITVVDIESRNRVKIGVNADSDITILRNELNEKPKEVLLQ